MKYKILFYGEGFTVHGNTRILNYNKYESYNDIPSFDEEIVPITKGIELFEQKGKIKIVDKKPDDFDVKLGTSSDAEIVSDIKVNSDAEFTREYLEKLGVAELNEICKNNNISGYSNLNKDPKIDFILENLGDEN